MAQHSPELPSHHTKQEMHKFPAFSLVEHGGRGGWCPDFPLLCVLMNEKRNKMVKNILNENINLLRAFMLWGHSLGFEKVYCCALKPS